MKENKTMKSLPEESRPYERCLRSGPSALTDAELLAVILRSGTVGASSVEVASKILDLCCFEKGLTGIFHLSTEELCGVRGVGKVKAVQVQCIGELSRRIAMASAHSRLQFDNAETIAHYYMEQFRHEEEENVLSVMLDTRNHFLGDVILTKGTVNLSLISPRELFIKALAYHAVNLILIHNHPSGDATPSEDDILITERVRLAGELLGIRLLDHIVLGDRCYVSLKENGFFEQSGPVGGESGGSAAPTGVAG